MRLLRRSKASAYSFASSENTNNCEVDEILSEPSLLSFDLSASDTNQSLDSAEMRRVATDILPAPDPAPIWQPPKFLRAPATDPIGLRTVAILTTMPPSRSGTLWTYNDTGSSIFNHSHSLSRKAVSLHKNGLDKYFVPIYVTVDVVHKQASKSTSSGLKAITCFPCILTYVYYGWWKHRRDRKSR
jgi:hypothetical protein